MNVGRTGSTHGARRRIPHSRRRIAAVLSGAAWLGDATWDEVVFASGPEQLGPARGRALLEIWRTPRSRTSDLASALGVSASTLTRTLDRLEADGLVERFGDHHDRRVVRVSTTAAGAELAEAVTERADRSLTAALEAFSATEIDELATLLDAVADATDEWLEVGAPLMAPPAD